MFKKIKKGAGVNESKKIVLIGMLILVFCVILGISYAYLSIFLTSGKENLVKIGAFLNGKYLTSGSYLTTDQVNMIEDNTMWYLGTVASGTSYKLAKYASATSTNLTSNTTTAKVGLLRLGELNAGQFDKFVNKTSYWTLTPYNTSIVRYVSSGGLAGIIGAANSYGARPMVNLKSNVVITSGDGTKENPFEVKLAG